MTWYSGMWDPVVSGPFWKQHPGCPVRSCSLLPGFKAQAKPPVASGWVISSRAGTGCIGRAPFPWGKQLHPCCLPHAHHLLHMLVNWISTAVSPVPLGSYLGWRRPSLRQTRWLQVGGKALKSHSGTSMDVGGPPWSSSPLLFSHPRRQIGALLKLKCGIQENSFFFLSVGNEEVVMKL